MNFVPLHTNSVYSYLSSALTIDALINETKHRNIPYASLTDINSLVAAVTFFNKCQKENIKPILGLDLMIEDNLFTFLIKDEEGYKNLLFISKLFNEKKLGLSDLEGKTKGLVIVLSSLQSNLINKLSNLGETKFAYYLKNINDVIDEFYIGLEIYSQEDKNNIKTFRDFLIKRNYSLLAFPLIRYIHQKDEIVYSIVQAIKNDTKINEKITSQNGVNYFYLDEEINNFYEEIEINNTNKIANEIHFNLLTKRGKLIRYSNNSDELLKETAYRLLSEKISITNEYKKRLDYELNVITKMGYSDYFLIVMDYVKFAKDHHIYVGPGRGSSGGSLVAYALNIITIDPLKEKLLFERFLNEGRKSMPDIDVDFEDGRRDEVVEYIRKKYGKNRVGNIITSQTIKAKQALRDIGRIYDVNNKFIDALCKATGSYDDLHEAYRHSPNFRQVVNSDTYFLDIVKLASKIEGFPRQAGMHAAGIIINDEPLENALPIYIDTFNNYLSELEKDDLETLGFLKMDILGLRNLTIIKNVINEVNKNKKILEYESLPTDDKNAINLIASGETLGLFQLESKGMIKTIKEFHPESFNDVVSLIALYRPGPMQFIPSFIKRKEGKEKIIYPSNKIVDILKDTYGIIVYQEQIMEIVRIMANFTYQEADLFRRAISKKDASKLASLKTIFISHSIKNGNSKKESEEVFDLIYRFANYGFNKSHAIVYAKLACQMAYLKYYYPSIFYAAILDDGDRFNDVVSEMRNHNLKIALPDINKAKLKYIANSNELIMPFTSIKGILSQAVINLIKEREKNGPYKDFIDFVIRNVAYKITNSTILKLIDSGAFDSFKINRASLRNAIDTTLNYGKLFYSEEKQLMLNDVFIPKPYIETIPSDEIYDINQEYLNLGIIISKSPLDFYQDKIKKEGATIISETKKDGFLKIVGIVKSIRRIKTRKDHKIMCFITLSDNIEDINVTVFNDVYTKHEQDLYNAKILIVCGRFDKIRGEVIANDLKIL